MTLPVHDPWAAPEISTSSGVTMSWSEVPVEPLAKEGGGPGYGSAIAVRRSPAQVFWSRLYGQHPVPWSRFDVASGVVTTKRARDGLRGDLRGALLDADGLHAWLLLSHALVRVDLETLEEVSVLREGWPKYRSHLFDLGSGLLAASGWTGSTLTVVDATRLSIVRTIRTPSPDAVVPSEDGQTVELLAFNAGIARTLDLGSLKLTRSRSLPVGKGAFVAGDQVWYVEGDREVDARAPLVRLVKGRCAAVLDSRTLEVQRHGVPVREPWAVVGLDSGDRPLVQFRTGWVLLDRDSLEPVAEVNYRRGEHFGGFVASSVALLPDGRSAVALPNSSWPERLWLFRW
jgi:hypothetical protein